MRAAVFYAACTLLLAYPLVLNVRSSAMPGDPDTDLFMWTLAWNTHALFTSPLSLFDANIYHPHPLTLAFSESLLGSTIFAAPILWMTGDHILALNITELLSIALSGLGAFVLGRRLGLTPLAALICGMVFAFSPGRFFRIGQMHLTTIQWIPFCLAYLHTYLAEARRRDLLIAIGFFTLQALTSGHAAVYLATAILFLLAWTLAQTRSLRPLLQWIRDAGIAGVLLLLPSVLIFIPYKQLQNQMGLIRTLADWETPFESFLASPTTLHTWIFETFWNTDFIERANAYLFPGFATLLLAGLAVAGLVRSRARNRENGTSGIRPSTVGLYLLVTIAAVLLSAGPPIGLWPYVHELPGLNFIRVPSRFMLLGMLSLAVLAGAGFETMVRGWPRRRIHVAAAVVAAVMIAECLTIPLPGHRPYEVRIPDADRWIATQPSARVIAEMPATELNERLQSTYMLHSTAHWRKTVHGHSGFRTPSHVELYTEMRRFPSEETLRSLAAVGVTHIIVHPEFYEEERWARVKEELPMVPWLQLVFDDGESRVYELRPMDIDIEGRVP